MGDAVVVVVGRVGRGAALDADVAVGTVHIPVVLKGRMAWRGKED